MARTPRVQCTLRLNCIWSFALQVKESVWEPWSDLELAVATDKAPEPVVLTGDDGAELNALRYRLNSRDIDATRPLPSTGKISVRHGKYSAEALLQLPVIELQTSEGPSLLWLSAGLLAVNGFVLQLKLKKAVKPKEKDKFTGNWHAYHVVGGAITCLADDTTTESTSKVQGAAQSQAAAKSQALSQGAQSTNGSGNAPDKVAAVSGTQRVPQEVPARRQPDAAAQADQSSKTRPAGGEAKADAAQQQVPVLQMDDDLNGLD